MDSTATRARTAGFGPWPYVLLTGAIFGSGGLIAKGLLDDGFGPATITWISFAIGGVVAALHLRRRPTSDHLRAGLALGVFTTAAPALFFNLGFDRLPAGTASLLIALGPVVTAVVAHFVFPDERFNRVKSVGLVLALLGVAILGSGDSGEGSATGVLFIVVGSLFAGTGAVLGRRFAVRFGGIDLITTQLVSAAAIVGAVALLFSETPSPDGGWETWHVAVLPIFGITGYIGFGSMLKANEIGSTGQVSVIGYLVPVVGVIGGVLVFNDAVTASVVIGGLLVLTSTAVIAAGSRLVRT